MDLTKFATTAEAVWVKFPGTDVEFLLTFSSAKDPRRFARNAMAKAQRTTRTTIGQADAVEDITLELLCKHVLKGLKNLEEDGKPLEFTPENVKRVLSDPKYVVIRDFISAESADPNNFGVDLEPEGTTAAADLKSGAGLGATVGRQPGLS